jgi:L-amino acid N-acyltransferase YncA
VAGQAKTESGKDAGSVNGSAICATEDAARRRFAAAEPHNAPRGRGPSLATATTAEIRDVRPDDWSRVAEIYWDGMRDGLATFETEVPTWQQWDAAHSLRLVAEVDGEVVGWAALAPVSKRRCYGGVTENTVYVAREARGLGVGRALLEKLIAQARKAGIWTIQASIFPENRASLALHERCGFRVVGTRERIAKRDGLWRDTVLLEKRL